MGRDSSHHTPKPWRIAAAGMVSLAVAMGIGRFAFTPLLPMMLADATLTLADASWLASVNYLGYLVGALLCSVQKPVSGPVMVRAGLAATVLLTLGMAIPWQPLWPVLRFCAGVASAVVFVYTSGWCLVQLARLHVASMGALIYVGPGAGIVVSGLCASAMVAASGTAQLGWLGFGLLAAALTAAVWSTIHPQAEPHPTAAPTAAPKDGVSKLRASEIAVLTAAYGLAGFGYIITATFLPVIARQAISGSPWLDLFWPLFGIGVMLGALTASRIPAVRDLRWLLIGCYLVQAMGILISLVSPSLWGFATGSLLLGLPFTAITYFAMQEVRRLRPAQAARAMGLATALYGLGQIAGPALVARLLAHSTNPAAGFTASLEIAAAALVVGAVLYGLLIRVYPVRAA